MRRQCRPPKRLQSRKEGAKEENREVSIRTSKYLTLGDKIRNSQFFSGVAWSIPVEWRSRNNAELRFERKHV